MHRRWTFRTKHGLWAIARAPDGRWHAMLDDDSLGSYHSPAAALDDLVAGATFATPSGVDSASVGLPGDLSAWTAHAAQA